MDEDAEDASPAREDADRGVRLLVDPRCQEALEILSAAIDHAERRVARFGQLGGRVDDALQQRVERELGAERDASVQQPPKSIHSPNLPRKSFPSCQPPKRFRSCAVPVLAPNGSRTAERGLPCGI